MASVDRKILINQKPITSATSTSDVQSLEGQHFGFIGEIIAADVNAATTVAGKIQHSADKQYWHDLISFTDIVGTAGSELKTATACLPNIRSFVTLSGGTKAATVTIRMHYDRYK